jgi:hypothetical protein
MTAPTGVYARRNAGHRTYTDTKLAAATGTARLAAAYDSFRASAKLLAKRRTPRGVSQDVHRDTAARLTAEAAASLEALALRIDRGEFDANSPGKG